MNFIGFPSCFIDEVLKTYEFHRFPSFFRARDLILSILEPRLDSVPGPSDSQNLQTPDNHFPIMFLYQFLYKIYTFHFFEGWGTSLGFPWLSLSTFPHSVAMTSKLAKTYVIHRFSLIYDLHIAPNLCIS